jgi:hypothetical protein
MPTIMTTCEILRFASDSTSNNSFSTAIDAAAGLIQVAVGLTVGPLARPACVCAKRAGFSQLGAGGD